MVRSPRRRVALVAVAVLACSSGGGSGGDASPAVGGVTLSAGDLTATFAGNEASPGQLSGVRSLFHQAAPTFDAFDPDAPGTGAGLNFEHVIAPALPRDWRNEVTPRFGPMPLYVVDDRTVELRRDSADSPWGVGATIRYAVVEPHYIDMDFRCDFTRPEEFADGGAMLFFASYMNDVVEPGINFVTPHGWAYEDFADPRAHPDWNTGGSVRGAGSAPLPYAVGHAFALNLWALDDPLAAESFYWGLMEHGMVWAIAFDRDPSPADEIRFTVFRWKLPVPRPAWDWSYVVRDPAAGPCGFRARAIFKPFVSAADVEDEYLAWRASL